MKSLHQVVTQVATPLRLDDKRVDYASKNIGIPPTGGWLIDRSGVYRTVTREARQPCDFAGLACREMARNTAVWRPSGDPSGYQRRGQCQSKM